MTDRPDSESRSLNRRLQLALAFVLLVLTAYAGAPATAGATSGIYVYDALAETRVGIHHVNAVEAGPAQLSNARKQSASPTPRARGACTTSFALRNATEAAGEAARAVTRPAGVADDFVSEVANNGKGAVWRAPGSTGNAGTVRIMEPTAQYPDGYVRFYNDSGQPIGLNGQPGANSVTHIPLNPDGSYRLPKGWGG